MPSGGPIHTSAVIPRHSSFASLEDLSADIARRQLSGERVSLRVPHELISDDFGLVECVVQVIATWASGDADRTLHSYFDPKWSDEQCTAILRGGPHLLAAVIAAKTVLSSQGIDITRRMTSLVREVAAQEADSPSLDNAGSAAFFMYESKRDQWAAVAHRLYDRVPVRSWMWMTDAPRRAWPFPQAARPRVQRGGAFTEWLTTLSHRLVRGREIEIPDEPFTHLSTAVSELLDNADVWGRPKDPSDPSFWMLRAEWTINTYEGLARLGKGDRAVSSFAERQSGEGQMLHAIYSIVDAGPGIFSRRIDRADLRDHRSQFEVVRTLLGEGITDDHGGRGENRGMGFVNVFESLTSLGGVLRIRTGALSISRDFVASPLTDVERSRPRIFDSTTGEESPTPHPEMTGTAITLIVPTKRAPN